MPRVPSSRLTVSPESPTCRVSKDPRSSWPGPLCVQLLDQHLASGSQAYEGWLSAVQPPGRRHQRHSTWVRQLPALFYSLWVFQCTGKHACMQGRGNRDFGKQAGTGAGGLGSGWGGSVGKVEGDRKRWQRPGGKEGGRKVVTLVWVAGRARSLCYTASGGRPWQGWMLSVRLLEACGPPSSGVSLFHLFTRACIHTFFHNYLLNHQVWNSTLECELRNQSACVKSCLYFLPAL